MSKFQIVVIWLAPFIVIASTLPMEGSSSRSISSEKGCVFIEDCKPLLWIVKDLKSAQNKTASIVNESLK